jgi:hypothetical protein
MFNASMTAGLVHSKINPRQLVLGPIDPAIMTLGREAQAFYDEYIQPNPEFSGESVDSYERFFQLYGTHLPGKISLGGVTTMWYWSAQEYLALNGDASLEADAKANLLWWASAEFIQASQFATSTIKWTMRSTTTFARQRLPRHSQPFVPGRAWKDSSRGWRWL